MTQHDFDAVCVGFCVGAGLFTWVGYQLRRRVERAEKRWWGVSSGTESQRRTPPVVGRDYPVPLPKHSPPRATSRSDQKHPHHIPIPAVTPTHDAAHVMSSPEIHKDYEDVITALTGAGYRRAEAVEAVRTCTAGERAAGIEQWTVAALRRAGTTK